MFRHLVKSVPVLLSVVTSMLFLGGCTDHTREKPVVKDEIQKEEIQIEEILVEGLEEEYDFLFLTDMHIVAMSGKDSSKEQESAKERKAQFVNAEGIGSAEQFPEWIAYANEQAYEAVLLGGDLIDAPTGGNLELLEEQLKKLEKPYLYTPGNHDWTQPWEYMTQTAIEEYRPRLAPYMNDCPEIQCLDMGEIRIIAVDNSIDQVHQEALAEYEELLHTEKKVIVLLHVPLITQSVLGRAKEVWSSPVVLGGGNYGGIYPDESSQRFMDLTTAADSPVELVLAGHVHFYDKDYIEGEKKVLQIVGPAGYAGGAIHLQVKASDEPKK